jgi:PBP1b-binding outer membrane lipoprotein LpoB
MKVLISALMVAMFASCSSYGPLTATSNSVGKKQGMSCAKQALFFIPLGKQDMTINSAAKDGGIKSISHVDWSMKNYILFQKRCAHVYGK